MTQQFPDALSTGIQSIVPCLNPHASDALIRDDVEHAVHSERASVASLERNGIRGGSATSSDLRRPAPSEKIQLSPAAVLPGTKLR